MSSHDPDIYPEASNPLRWRNGRKKQSNDNNMGSRNDFMEECGQGAPDKTNEEQMSADLLYKQTGKKDPCTNRKISVKAKPSPLNGNGVWMRRPTQHPPHENEAYVTNDDHSWF